MPAVRRALVTVVAVGASALTFATGGPAAAGAGSSWPAFIQTTSYPWVQPPPGTGATAPQGPVAQQICRSVQLACTIPLR